MELGQLWILEQKKGLQFEKMVVFF